MEIFPKYYPSMLRNGLWRVYREMRASAVVADKGSAGEALGGKRNNNSNPRRPRIPRIRSDGTGSPLVLVLGLSVLLLVLCAGFGEACGPGRGAGRRRAPRKLTPLVYKEHVPNFPENALSASGLPEGKITRRDYARFKDLVPNYNTDILFRDDEGTAADRLMTQRCKEKLNTLAISVMNQWPGVRLRVNEGWDEDGVHEPQSLHYEGRAVDIATSDKDRSKFGMLARLAVEAGFDWVYYESKHHIHASVKSDSSQAGRAHGCFSANSTVSTRGRGDQRISELRVGEEVLTVNEEGSLTFAPVLLFLDRNTSEVRQFVHITTNSSRQLTLTPSHLLFSLRTLPPEYYSRHWTPADLLSHANITFAGNIQIGDFLLTMENGSLILDQVLRLRAGVETGVFAPLTTAGTILVDGVLSSCYALIESQSLAHGAFWPIRAAHALANGVARMYDKFRLMVTPLYNGGGNEGVIMRILSHRERSAAPAGEGIYWYASFLYSVTHHVLPDYLLYDTATVTAAVE